MRNKTIRKAWLFILIAVFSIFPCCQKTPAVETSETTITILIGDDYALIGADGASWTSANEAVAKVDAKGRVIAVSEGETTITATSGSTIEKWIVKVNKPQTISTESICFTQTQAFIQVGQSLTLETAIHKNGEIVEQAPDFRSENTLIATIDKNGVVTAASVGEVKIIATYGVATAICTVYVSQDGENLLLNQNSLELQVGENFALTVTPAETAVVWTATGDSVIVSDQGKITALKAGETVVKATVNGVSAYCLVKVYAVKEIENVNGFLQITDNPYVSYKLMQDLDFSDYEWAQKTLVPKLSSRFDGNGYKLYNLKRAVASDRLGIFGEIASTGRVENLAVYIDEFAYTDNSGALAVYNYGTIENCYVKITATADKSATTTMLLRSGIVYENYGAMRDLLVDVNATSGMTKTVTFHAFAAKNFGTIENGLVISSASATRDVKNEEGTAIKHIYYQLLSGTSDVAHYDGYGYKTTGTADNAQDKRRENCLIFETLVQLLSFGNGGYAIDGSKGMVPNGEQDQLKITESDILNAFDTQIWAFGTTLVTFFGRALYTA